MEDVGDLFQAGTGFQVGGKDGSDDGRLRRLDLDASGLAWALGMQPVGVGRAGPGEQDARTQLRKPTPAHALRNEGALVRGDRTANLEQQVVVGILTHGVVEKLHQAALTFQFL